MMTSHIDGAIQVISGVQLRVGNQMSSPVDYGISCDASGSSASYQGQNTELMMSPRFGGVTPPPPPQYFNSISSRRTPAGNAGRHLPFVPPPQQLPPLPLPLPTVTSPHQQAAAMPMPTSSTYSSAQPDLQQRASLSPPTEVLGELSDEQIRAILQSNPELLKSFAAARRL
jgi:hypothetical protein